ncbi:MAG: Wzz/FepE/Etk N-terminal domain-containing protein [Clostridia bacterium]|nr:Wzz/FepE/Etk N-terminal domain-containing protein [Clostridia bacterium]
MEKEINIQDIISEAMKRWWLILISVIVCGAAFYVYSEFVVDELFTSTGSVYVNNKAQEILATENVNNTANLYDLTTAEMLVDTYIEVLSSNRFFSLIEKSIDTPYSAKQLKSMVSYERVEETGVIYVNVRSFSPEDAKQICDAVLTFANYHIMTVMEVGSVRTIDEASMPDHHSYPNITTNTLLGMIFGGLLALVIIFLINYFDVRIKNIEDIESKYDLVVLGTIPNMFINNTSNGGGDYE